jgi:uncharacterized membrane protein (DUF2068 family)
MPIYEPPQVDTLEQRTRRPFGVTIIAVLQALSGLSAGAFVVVVRAGSLTIVDPELAAQSVALFAVGLVIAVGLWRLKRWAWVSVMVWTGLELAGGLLSYFRGDPDYPSMVLGIIIVFYLNQADVQAAFRSRRRAPAVRS